MRSPSVEDGFSIAVLLPVRNQASTIASVVRGFAAALPGARLYVFDNNSTDDTARAAAAAGAHVFRETRPGKDNVVRRMFADIEADIYVMADGDGSHDPADAPSLVNALITEHVDMVVGTRRSGAATAAAASDMLYRRLFGGALTDVFSGYRAFTRRFVKSFPAIPTGFPIEAEMSIHASQLMIPVAEIELADGPARNERPAKAEVLRADLKALGTHALLAKEARPFAFFAVPAVLLWVVGLMTMGPSLPAAVTALGFMLAGFFLAGLGLVLDGLNRSRIEQKRILFLAAPALGAQ